MNLRSALLLACALALPAFAADLDAGVAPGHGLDLVGMDKAVKPGDDFFRYANGGWEKATEIPADKSRWGIFSVMAEDTLQRTRKLLEESASAPAGSDAKKAADYFASYLDEAAIEAKGLTPLKGPLARIAALKDKKALAKELGEELRNDVDPLNNTSFATSRLFGTWISANFNAPTEYVPYLLQGGLGLPDREYYLDQSPRMAEFRAKYQEHIAAVFKLAGLEGGEEKAARVMALEKKIAQVHATREDSGEVLKANNPWKRTEFAKKAPGLDWNTFFTAAGLGKATTIVVWHPGAITGLSALVASEPLDTWKEWATFHTINRAAPFLTKAFVDERFGFYGKTLNGTPQLSDRWKRAVSNTNGALGDAVGALWVKRYFPPEAKAQIQALVKSVVTAFGARVDALDWMAPATKAKAKEKLATLYVGVGYPDKFIDYKALSIVPGDAFGNAERAELFDYQRDLAKLGKKVDVTEWCMTPQTVNAVNLPVQNALNFPAAILQPPFFDPLATPAMNFGGIGATIGHEISHSFDDQGAMFDAQGKLSNWWTKEDLEHFQASGTQLAEQYSKYKPFPDLNVNGKLTLGENLADLAGLSAAHEGWLASLGGQPAPLAQGLTGEQQFFLSYAQSWRFKAREKSLRQQVIVDGHAPEEYRADTVRNLDAWYTAFNVKQGEKLFLAPNDRVKVW